MQRELRQERARLTRLRARLLVVRRALAARLVELYKADAPDAITVVLESDGFADLLTRTEFMERVSRQDAKIMDIVADAKADATATAKRLDTLEKRRGQGRQADRVPARRGLDDPRRPRRPPRPHPDAPARPSSRCCASSRDRRHELEDDVGELQAAQAKIQAKLAGLLAAPRHRRPDQARLGRPDLARQRPDHLAVLRVALVGVLPPGHRHRRPGRHADPRRRRGQGRADAVRGRLRRLRQLHLHPARRRAVDVLRAPVALRHLAGRARSTRAR